MWLLAVDLGAGTRPLSTVMRMPDCRHLVSTAICADELLASAGGLVQRVAASGARVDVLIVTDELPTDLPDDGDDQPAPYEPVAIPGVRWHRLGLRRPIRESGVADLVAAMSELIGFDPDPGLCCLAPLAPGLEPDRDAVGRAAALTAGAYRVPLVRYLTAEPDDLDVRVLELDEREWERKRTALAARANGGPASDAPRCELFLD